MRTIILLLACAVLAAVEYPYARIVYDRGQEGKPDIVVVDGWYCPETLWHMGAPDPFCAPLAKERIKKVTYAQKPPRTPEWFKKIVADYKAELAKKAKP